MAFLHRLKLKLAATGETNQSTVNRRLLAQFVEGLQPHIKTHVMRHQPASVEDALKFAECETSLECLHVNRVEPQEEVNRRIDALERMIEKLTVSLSANNDRKPEIECYYCGHRGHTQRNCGKRLADRQVSTTNEISGNVKGSAQWGMARPPRQ